MCVILLPDYLEDHLSPCEQDSGTSKLRSLWGVRMITGHSDNNLVHATHKTDTAVWSAVSLEGLEQWFSTSWSTPL